MYTASDFQTCNDFYSLHSCWALPPYHYQLRIFTRELLSIKNKTNSIAAQRWWAAAAASEKTTLQLFHIIFYMQMMMCVCVLRGKSIVDQCRRIRFWASVVIGVVCVLGAKKVQYCVVCFAHTAPYSAAKMRNIWNSFGQNMNLDQAQTMFPLLPYIEHVNSVLVDLKYFSCSYSLLLRLELICGAQITIICSADSCLSFSTSMFLWDHACDRGLDFSCYASF